MIFRHDLSPWPKMYSGNITKALPDLIAYIISVFGVY